MGKLDWRNLYINEWQRLHRYIDEYSDNKIQCDYVTQQLQNLNKIYKQLQQECITHKKKL